MNRYRTLLLRALAIGIALTAMTGLTSGQSSSDPLEQGFQQPPDSAKPRVWWHWMNGNITKEGIKLDLEWMHRVRLRGFQIFDAALATPQVVTHRLAYMTPEWKDAFKYATTLADQLGMEEAIAGSPGWSETGGPWVPGSQGMKKYVWSETFVEAGKPFTGTLAHPPSNTGAFQNLGVRDLLAAPQGAPPPPSFYADGVVIAYRRPEKAPGSNTNLPTPRRCVLSPSSQKMSTLLPRWWPGSRTRRSRLRPVTTGKASGKL